MHTPVLFEHPLNEKMRTAAHRILIQQMAFRPQIASHADALHFSVTPAICWMSERGEVRTDTVKSWNASSVSCSHGQKCRASIRSALTSCATS